MYPHYDKGSHKMCLEKLYVGLCMSLNLCPNINFQFCWPICERVKFLSEITYSSIKLINYLKVPKLSYIWPFWKLLIVTRTEGRIIVQIR